MAPVLYDNQSILALSGRVSRALTRAFFDLCVGAMALVLGLGTVVFTLWTALSLFAATAGGDPLSWSMCTQAFGLATFCIAAEFLLVLAYLRVRSWPAFN